MGQFRDRMDEELRIRGYSANTRECYLRGVHNFVCHFMRPPDQLTLAHTRLRVSDIDRQRMVIRIEQGKGRKDRSVMLSPSLHAVLHEDAKAVHPQTVLFPSRAGGGPRSPRSVYRIFVRAKTRARIRTQVSPSSLRHAAATHLLERGTTLRVIQLLLGHPSLRTTQISTQVADPHLQVTQSSLDRLPNLPSLPPSHALKGREAGAGAP